MKTAVPAVAEIPSLGLPKLTISSPKAAGPATTAAYDHYFRLHELSELWSSRQFPEWESEAVVKPSLQALEITFRFISHVLSDARPYANHREWARRIESLASRQLELVAAFCSDDNGAGAPTCQLSSSGEGGWQTTRKRGSSQEVWKIPGSSPVVSRTSEESLLPRLAAWEKSQSIASKLLMEVECQMCRAPFTLGLGEPNLSGKPYLEYDLVCRPSLLHSLAMTKAKAKTKVKGKMKKKGSNMIQEEEEENTFTTHQIMESWVFVAKQLLARVEVRMEQRRWGSAASDCWLLERVWRILAEIEDLHMLMDPDNFLKLKRDLGIGNSTSGYDALCFRSTALVELTKSCSRGLKRWVPYVLGVEVDPEGGPRLEEAAMNLFRRKINKEGEEEEDGGQKVHLLQAFQAIDAVVKKFFFSYRQLIVSIMGSLDAKGNTCCEECYVNGVEEDPLKDIFMEPPYFPSLDAAKTFLGDLYQHGHSSASLDRLLDSGHFFSSASTGQCWTTPPPPPPGPPSPKNSSLSL